MNRLKLLMAAGVLACSACVQGAVIYTNFGAGDSYSDSHPWSVGFPPSPAGSELRVAVPFLVTGNYSLTSVRAAPALYASPNNFTVSVNADNGGIPGQVVETFSKTTFAEPFAITTFNSSLNPLLTSGSTYWVVMSAVATPSWAGWISNNQGLVGAWVAYTDNQFTWTLYNAEGQYTPVFEVNGNLANGVPEPSAIALTALGVAGLLIRRRGR